MQAKIDKISVTVQLPSDVVAVLEAEGVPEGLKRAAVVRRALLRHVQAQASTPAPTQSTTTPPRAA